MAHILYRVISTCLILSFMHSVNTDLRHSRLLCFRHEEFKLHYYLNPLNLLFLSFDLLLRTHEDRHAYDYHGYHSFVYLSFTIMRNHVSVPFLLFLVSVLTLFLWCILCYEVFVAGGVILSSTIIYSMPMLQKVCFKF